MSAARQALEARARADHARVAGCVLAVQRVLGYVGHDSVEVYLTSPALVRVDASVSASDLERWHDEFLDPVWPCTLVEPHAELADVRSLWIDGHSYCLTEVTTPERHVLRECPHCDVESGAHHPRCPLVGGAS